MGFPDSHNFRDSRPGGGLSHSIERQPAGYACSRQLCYHANVKSMHATDPLSMAIARCRLGMWTYQRLLAFGFKPSTGAGDSVHRSTIRSWHPSPGPERCPTARADSGRLDGGQTEGNARGSTLSRSLGYTATPPAWRLDVSQAAVAAHRRCAVRGLLHSSQLSSDEHRPIIAYVSLTPPSSGRPKGRCAPFAPPLMSNVRRRLRASSCAYVGETL